MIHLTQLLWPWLLASGILGAGIGWTAGRWPHGHRGGRTLDLLFWGLVGLVAAGVAVSLMHWLKGRPALWLDMALLMTGAYGAGCAIGAIVALVTRRAPGQHAEPGMPTPSEAIEPAETAVEDAPAVPPVTPAVSAVPVSEPPGGAGPSASEGPPPSAGPARRKNAKAASPQQRGVARKPSGTSSGRPAGPTAKARKDPSKPKT
jgi:hypothetical protein